MAELARSGETADLRVAAISCLGSWMNHDRGLTQEISETLLSARAESDDPIVRSLVIQSIGNMDTPLSPKVFDAMADAVITERDSNNRSLAAVALGSGTSPENRNAVLTALEKAYLSESELNTQRHIITQIAKAGGEQAEAWLQRLPTSDPRLEQDVKDYMEILASVDRSNWGAVWEAKSNRDDQRGTYPGGSGGHGHD